MSDTADVPMGVSNPRSDVRPWARQEERTLWEALCQEALEASGATGTRLAAFVDLISGLRALLEKSSALEVAREVLARTGYLEWLQKDDSVEGETRADNVQALLGALAEFTERRADNTLAAWLDEVALVSATDAEADGPAVVLMTAHMAKGLEFDVVFVTGIESELMPHSNSHEDPHAIEEERRLLYVAMTRARHHLHLSWAASRRRYGKTLPAMRSQFLDGLPAEHLHDDNPAPRRRGFLDRDDDDLTWRRAPSPRQPTARDAADFADPTPDWENESQDRDTERTRHRVLGSAITPSAGGWSRGMRAFHPQFGEGLVTDVEGQGERAKVTVRFWDGTTRKLIAKILSEP